MYARVWPSQGVLLLIENVFILFIILSFYHGDSSQPPAVYVSSTIDRVHAENSILKTFCEENALKLRPRDKGSVGKLVEFHIFGRLPNNDTAPDLGIEVGDLKVTHVKRTRNGFTAKERLTLSNCGSTGDYKTLQHLLADMKDIRLYPKIRRGVVVVFEHSTAKNVYNENVLDAFQYDLETLPDDMRCVVQDDYAKIQECVRKEAVSQRGQKFLHIHPHGSKGSKTRALGFTNKFLTKLICHYTGREMKIIGNSWVF